MALPSGYKRLKFLESTGTQLIDTGVIPNQDTSIEIEFTIKSIENFGSSAGSGAYGGSSSYNSNAFECFTQKEQIEFGYDGQYQLIGSPSVGDRIKVIHDKNNVTISINGGTSETLSFDYVSFTSPYSLILFGVQRSTIYKGAGVIIHYCKIKQNGVLVRDYFPIMTASAEAGFWENVSGAFYGNDGTGAFVAGPEDDPLPPHDGHNTNIGQVARQIEAGTVLFDGAGREIESGLTLVGGVVREIPFAPDVDPVLGNNTPEQIQAVAQSGQAANYWSVGDMIGIPLSGTVGALTLNGTYYAFILGFDHNSSIEGSNSIHFQFGKTSAGVDIAFVDTLYGSVTTSKNGLTMNYTDTNAGGWERSTMRAVRCAEFLSAMPSAWQSAIAACTKYSDNIGGGGNTDRYVTTTSDEIWPLSEFEVQGTKTYANGAEQNYQKQYDYYKNGNSKVKYKHNATTTACIWQLRSVRAANSSGFCRVGADGSASATRANRSSGFAPGFKVA